MATAKPQLLEFVGPKLTAPQTETLAMLLRGVIPGNTPIQIASLSSAVWIVMELTIYVIPPEGGYTARERC